MYRELPAPTDLRALVACTWLQHAPTATAVQVVPDACLDLLWNGSVLRVAGPDTRPVRERCPGGHGIIGLRFRPGAASAILGVPASVLCDQRVVLTELCGESAYGLDDALRALRDRQRALSLLADWVRLRAPRVAAPDPLVQQLIARLSGPAPRIAELSRELGVSERMLHRRTVAQVGYGPKLLGRVLRLRAFRSALALTPRKALATLAVELGFADQAHLTHEASELFGTTPGRMQRAALSDFDKTPRTAPRHAERHDNPRALSHRTR